MILYFFYKNMIFTIPQFYFAFYSGFSGVTFFDGLMLVTYNMVFTALPLQVKAVLEQDVNYKEYDHKTKTTFENDIIKLNYSKLYYVGQKNTLFTTG